MSFFINKMSFPFPAVNMLPFLLEPTKAMMLQCNHYSRGLQTSCNHPPPPSSGGVQSRTSSLSVQNWLQSTADMSSGGVKRSFICICNCSSELASLSQLDLKSSGIRFWTIYILTILNWETTYLLGIPLDILHIISFTLNSYHFFSPHIGFLVFNFLYLCPLLQNYELAKVKYNMKYFIVLIYMAKGWRKRIKIVIESSF